MTLRYRVDLSEAERNELTTMLNGGTQPVRKLKRAQILLAADAGVLDEAIAITLAVSLSTVTRKARFRDGQSPSRAQRGAAPRRRTQIDRTGGSAAGRDRLFDAARRVCPLDVGPAGGCAGHTHRA